MMTKLLNLRQGQIEQTLKYLSVERPSPIIKEGSKWKRTAIEYQMDLEKIERINNQRIFEWEEVKYYLKTDKCLMQFLQNTLDDPNSYRCGRCFNCNINLRLSDTVEHEDEVESMLFLQRSEFEIAPRVKIENEALSEYGWSGLLPKELRAERGKALSRWGDAGWGRIVANDKHINHFRDELVDAMKDMITIRWNPDPYPKWVTCIPSENHPELVPDFASRLAEKLNIPFFPLVKKVKYNRPQKLQENSFHQCKNLDGVFDIQGEVSTGPVLLVDDAVDSRWTLTIVAALLRSKGSGPVYPTVLTSTSVKE